MKAPDIVESWKWSSPEEIIERLLTISSRPASVMTAPLPAQKQRDKYYTQARRLHVRRMVKAAMR